MSESRPYAGSVSPGMVIQFRRFLVGNGRGGRGGSRLSKLNISTMLKNL